MSDRFKVNNLISCFFEKSCFPLSEMIFYLESILINSFCFITHYHSLSHEVKLQNGNYLKGSAQIFVNWKKATWMGQQTKRINWRKNSANFSRPRQTWSLNGLRKVGKIGCLMGNIGRMEANPKLLLYFSCLYKG